MPTLVRDGKQVNRNARKASPGVVQAAELEAWAVVVVKPTGKFQPTSPTDTPRSFKPVRCLWTRLTRSDAQQRQAEYNGRMMKRRCKTWAILRADKALALAQWQAADMERRSDAVQNEFGGLSVVAERAGKRILVNVELIADFYLGTGALERQVLKSIRATLASIERRLRRKSA